MSGQTWAKKFQPGAIRTNFRSGVRTKTPSEVSGCSLYNQGSYSEVLIVLLTNHFTQIDGPVDFFLLEFGKYASVRNVVTFLSL